MTHLLIEILEALLKVMKIASDDIFKWFPKAMYLFWHFFEAVALPEVLQSFFMSLSLAVLLIILVVAVHLGINSIRRRRTLTFISYQHDMEPIADTLAAEMARFGICGTKLPFVENPNHDLLLDQVKHSIRACDVFVCIPGDSPSFVESEVSMAFALEKPLLFVLSEKSEPRLPNTAKKGYPVFSLESLECKGYQSFINFCSYLSADIRSTFHLYVAIFRHLWACAGFLVGVYILSIMLTTGLIGTFSDFTGPELYSSFLLLPKTLLSHPSIVCFVVISWILFLIPYAAFFLTRCVYRTKLRRDVSGKQFHESYLPKILDYSLRKDDLQQVLYHGKIVAEHEVGDLQNSLEADEKYVFPADKYVFPADNKKLILEGIGGCAGFIFLGVLAFTYIDGLLSTLIGLPLILLGVVGVVVLLSLKAQLSNDLIINSDGIIDNLENPDVGLISWDEIARLSVEEKKSDRFLILHVYNPERYLGKVDFLTRLTYKKLYRQYGSPIRISMDDRKDNLNELLQIIQRYNKNSVIA